MAKKRKIDVGSESSGFGDNPFDGLSTTGLPLGEIIEPKTEVVKESNIASRNRGKKIVVRKEKSGRGGKTVTVVDGIVCSEQERKQMLKRLQGQLGVGGAVKEGNIELQGDKREELATILRADGFRVVVSGG